MVKPRRFFPINYRPLSVINILRSNPLLLPLPFLLILPGFMSEEISSWSEKGETWRRLHIRFPNDKAYHSRDQVLYFDSNGLLKRMDYEVEISGNTKAAQYVYDYRDFDGIKVPTRRMVYGRDDNGSPISEPLIVGIELLDVEFK